MYYYKMNQLAHLSKIPRRTIIFYLEKALLHPPLKTGKTMAYYDESHYRKLLFIKNMKKKGLPLMTIRRMIESREANGSGFGRRLTEHEMATGTKKRPPRKNQGKLTRKRIIEEGSFFFQEKGFKDTRVNEIIVKLNIGKGSFYANFSNKKELFLECIPLIFERFFAEGWNKIREESNPYKRLILRAEITLPVIDKFFNILNFCQEAAKEKDPNIRKLGEQIYYSIYSPIEKDISSGIEQGIFRKVNPTLYSLLLISTMQGINSITTMNPDISITSIRDSLLDMLAGGLVMSKASETR